MIHLSKYEKRILVKLAAEHGFIRETLEKVYRLVDILEYFYQNPFLKERLALKGGTAINLHIFNLPRLSVDIDLDYCNPVAKNEMLKEREKINDDILTYLKRQGYSLSPKSKNYHSLDSYVFYYTNSAGNKDIIKIEINYSLRGHILPVKGTKIVTDILNDKYTTTTLDPIEIFAGKINALINRAAARDLYDINNMIYFGLFSQDDFVLLRKAVVFYRAISSKDISTDIDFSNIDNISQYDIRTSLVPVLRRKDNFDLEISKERVKEYLGNLLVLTEREMKFLDSFDNNLYCPELLFDDEDIVKRIINHPMAIWKTMQR